MKTSEKVRSIVFAFDRHDDRRQAIRELADEVERLETELEAAAKELQRHAKDNNRQG